MKIFICALCALVAVSVAVALSGCYITKAVRELDRSIAALPEALPEGEELTDGVLKVLDVATADFKSRGTLISALIGHRELDETDTLLATLSSAARARDDAYYRTTLAALREKLEKLAVSERLTLAGIL